MPTGFVINKDKGSLIAALESNLRDDFQGTISVQSLSVSEDGKYNLSVSFVSAAGSSGYLFLTDVDNPYGLQQLQTGYNEQFATDMIYVGGDFNFTTATVRLPKYAPISMILKCPDEEWHENNLSCDQWKRTNISFVETDNSIEFNVTSFSGFVGTSYIYDTFESGTNYCTSIEDTQWYDAVCQSGAGSFTIMSDASLAYMGRKFANVTKLNSGNSSRIRVEVYDVYGTTKSNIYSRVYLNAQNVSVSSGSTDAWIFMGVWDATLPLPYLQAFAYFDENESLGCGYFSDPAQGTLTGCSNQTKQHLNTNTWHTVELFYNATGGISCWLNGTVFCNQTGINFSNEEIQHVSLGVIDNSVANATGTLLFDEYRVSNQKIGSYPLIRNVTLPTSMVYDDQNLSLWALITDPDTEDSIQLVWLNKSTTELFLLPQASGQTIVGYLTNTGSNYSLAINESLYAKSASSDSLTVTYTLLANDSNGQIQQVQGSFEVLDGNPVVSLITPADGTYFASPNVTLTCNVTDPTANLYNITIYTNISGTFIENASTNISGNSSSVSMNLSSLLDGVYHWNCLAYDTESLDGNAANIAWGDINRTFIIDTTAPGSIANLTHENASLTWIKWNWSNPTNNDFNHTEIWLNGSWVANLSTPTTSYVATSLTNTTNYTVSIRTADHAGNVNQSAVNHTASTNAVPDTLSPSTLSNLTNVSITDASITWNWTNPSENDYNHVELYVNGTFVVNISYTLHNYTATGLLNNTNYTLSTRTVDHSGNINSTWVNHTTTTAVDTTAPASISTLRKEAQDSSWITWNWSNPLTGDYNYSLLYLNGSLATTVYQPTNRYNATGLLASTVYTLSILTVDHLGNVNTTWVNNSGQTSASYCGDARCDGTESCSLCVIDCGDCPVGEQQGSNLVVPVVILEPKISRAWDILDENAEVVWRITDQEMGVKEISFTTKKVMENAEISLAAYTQRPSGLYQTIPGSLYYYLKIETMNMDSTSLDDVQFQFTVEKTWLDANNLTSEDVVLYRYTVDWVALPTIKVAEDSTIVTYESNSPGFSYFAIGGNKKEKTGVETPLEELTTQPVVVGESISIPKEPVVETPRTIINLTNTSDASDKPWTFFIPRGDLLMLFVFIGLLISVGGIKYWRRKRIKASDNHQNL
ncbi:PGF-pre-PGF domain-containing protein [Candidatus Woesearchaeota archaeon]|nr:PGF-pre-PGF domain-containing protein [Candidatus Woesearchaeota archaeon]